MRDFDLAHLPQEVQDSLVRFLQALLRHSPATAITLVPPPVPPELPAASPPGVPMGLWRGLAMRPAP